MNQDRDPIIRRSARRIVPIGELRAVTRGEARQRRHRAAVNRPRGFGDRAQFGQARQRGRNHRREQAAITAIQTALSENSARMLDLFGKGTMRPVVDAMFPLADAAAAHRRMEEAAQFGKIVLRI